MDLDERKRLAAEKALEFVEDGMILGLGTGSTAEKFVAALGARVAEGLNVIGVPTSRETQAQAERLGIPLATLDEQPHLDITIDGADEIDPELRLIKGGGGALLREKIVAMASEQMVVIADDSKCVDVLGKFPLPIEVEPFGLRATRLMIEALSQEVGCEGEFKLRVNADGTPFKTDGGHLILDCMFGEIPEADALAEALAMVPGVIESGLFIALADVAIIGGAEGITLIEAPDV